jgi:hypothetical protein
LSGFGNVWGESVNVAATPSCNPFAIHISLSLPREARNQHVLLRWVSEERSLITSQQKIVLGQLRSMNIYVSAFSIIWLSVL